MTKSEDAWHEFRRNVLNRRDIDRDFIQPSKEMIAAREIVMKNLGVSVGPAPRTMHKTAQAPLLGTPNHLENE